MVGGGNAAVQSALSLAELCSKVTLIHRREGFRAEPLLLERLRSKENVEFRLGAVVSELIGEGRVSSVELTYADRKEEMALDGLFIAIGQQPANEPFADLCDLDEQGYIDAGEDCRTRTPGVFVAGDCRKKKVRQLATAAGDGAVAGLAAIDYLDNL